MGEKVLSVDALRGDLRSLTNAYDFLNAHVKRPYLTYSPEVRQLYVGRAMLNLTHDWDFTNDIMAKQGGGENWRLSLEERADLPDRAIERLKESFERRSASMWPWLAMAQEPEKVDLFLQIYKKVARASGLFPAVPSLEAVPTQRNIDWRMRDLALELVFAQKCAETPHLGYVGGQFLLMIHTAREAYMRHSEEEMQSAILAKAKNLEAPQIAALTKDGLWSDKESLSYMCVDRGLRDLIITYYGLFRSVFIPKLSGYSDGQDIMHKRVVLHQCLRVAA